MLLGVCHFVAYELTQSSFALMEINITLVTLFRRFEFELFDTVKERDIDTARDCFLAEPLPGSLGVRVRVVRERE